MAVLVVEDEPDMREVIAFILRRAGLDVVTAIDGESAIGMWQQYNPELVLLDLRLPRKSGWEVWNEIRARSTTPVIIVSGSDNEDDMVKVLDLGAEDYVSKPFSPKLFQARVQSILRRSYRASQSPRESSSAGNLFLNRARHELTYQDQVCQLTRTEFLILEYFNLYAGQVVTYHELIQHVWGYDHEDGSKLVKGHILNLRKKLAALGSQWVISTVPCVGYVLEELSQGRVTELHRFLPENKPIGPAFVIDSA
jgi:DNA-binding response OmpR family regulator